MTGHVEPAQPHPSAFEERDRFAFGTNWIRFVAKVDAGRIRSAEASLRTMLGVEHLDGVRFLDIGCGSGLFSLAAHRLGATVHSFDFDANSVVAARTLRDRYAADSQTWTVEEGSALDAEYLERFDPFEVVYSWGVLHHTGAMWQALSNAMTVVAPGGSLAISLYNDQGRASARWLRVKRAYNRTGRAGRAVLVALSAAQLAYSGGIMRRIVRGPWHPTNRETRGERARGMSAWHDLLDWVGGYPFEVSRPEEVFEFVSRQGFELTHLKTCGGGIGCNEYVFRRNGAHPTGPRVPDGSAESPVS